MQQAQQPTLTQSAFPVTGQPIRVIMIDGEPWFATLDVCRILGREQPHRANRLVEPHEAQTVNLKSITRTSSTGNREAAGQNGSLRGSPLLNVVSESGLYTLIMRSRKPSAKPFQQWVTSELLPSLRRGDADLGAHRQRMAETLSEALGEATELVARIEGVEEVDFQVLSDGSVLCRHGQTDVCVPNKSEDYGPPFGPFFRCPELRRVGIRGSKGIRPCGTIRFVDVVRRLAAPREPETPAAPAPAPTPPGQMSFTMGSMRVQGTPREMALLMHEMTELGVSPA